MRIYGSSIETAKLNLKIHDNFYARIFHFFYGGLRQICIHYTVLYI